MPITNCRQRALTHVRINGLPSTSCVLAICSGLNFKRRSLQTVVQERLPVNTSGISWYCSRSKSRQGFAPAFALAPALALSPHDGRMGWGQTWVGGLAELAGSLAGGAKFPLKVFPNARHKDPPSGSPWCSLPGLPLNLHFLITRLSAQLITFAGATHAEGLVNNDPSKKYSTCS